MTPPISRTIKKPNWILISEFEGSVEWNPVQLYFFQQSSNKIVGENEWLISVNEKLRRAALGRHLLAATIKQLNRIVLMNLDAWNR